MGELASSGLQKPLDTANQGKFKLMGMQDKINDALSVSGNVVDDVKNPQQKGGGFTCRFKKCKNIRSVPLKTRKRIMKAGYRRKDFRDLNRKLLFLNSKILLILIYQKMSLNVLELFYTLFFHFHLIDLYIP